MMELKTLIAKTANGPDLPRSGLTYAEWTARQFRMATQQFSTSSQLDGARIRRQPNRHPHRSQTTTAGYTSYRLFRQYKNDTRGGQK